MKSYPASAKNIDEYIGTFPKETQLQLEILRKTIHKAVPNAVEAIKYGIPTITFHGNLVHFGGFKNHISFFPTSSGIREFQKELSKYETSKGTIHFPINKKLPLGLISKIVKFRVAETLNKKRR